MKKLIIPAILLTAAPALAAIDCATLPSCSSLGYSETAGTCMGKYLTCPFDNTKIACLDSPKVGDLKYSLYSSNHDGWLKCDGTQYSTSTYSKLYSVIGTNFCRKYTSKSAYTSSACSSGKFAVPDYRGFFLRGINSYNASSNLVGTVGPSGYYGYAFNYMTGNYNSSVYNPQYEQLPNITGGFGIYNSTSDGKLFTTCSSYSEAIKGASWTSNSVCFNAGNSNSIYSGSHVIPANYGAYIFIYAGQ